MAIYDPLLSRSILSNQANIDSYWSSNYQLRSTEAISTLTAEKQADVVIIGAGYTGLNTAINLAQAGIKNIVIVEANQIGWGCSGRNAGFVLPGSGRLGYKQLSEKFGRHATQTLHNHFMQGIELIKTISDQYDVGRCETGYLKLAHSKKWFQRLQNSAKYLHNEFDYDVETIDQQAFQNEYVNHNKVYGAIRYNNGFGLHPLKLVDAYTQKALSLGVKIFTNSAVVNIQSTNHGHTLRTASGSITADKLVMATNGYTPSKMPTALKDRVLPVLTSVIVTEPLTSAQLKDANFNTTQVMMDTRELKYYYRLLPDNRILFGGRGAIAGKDATNTKYAQRLLTELHSSFPALNKVRAEFSWHGWISVSLDQVPHIYKTPNNIFYASGYCGSGVSFTALAGKQLADLVLGNSVDSPLISELPKFPFAPFRRLGQRAFYQWGRLKDSIG